MHKLITLPRVDVMVSKINVTSMEKKLRGLMSKLLIPGDLSSAEYS